MSEENIENTNKSDNNFGTTFVNHHVLLDINFNGHCLINNISFPKTLINLYVSYILNPWLRNLNSDFTLYNCFFGFAKLTKNDDLDKYKCSDFCIESDFRPEFSFRDGSVGKKNIVLFGANLRSSAYIDNEEKDILIFREGLTRGLDDTTLIAEAKHRIIFTQSGKRFVLGQRYNGSNSFLFVNATKMYQFKAKASEIKDYTPCLLNIAKDFTINDMKKTKLKESVILFLLVLIPLKQNI